MENISVLDDLKISVFLDGANLQDISEYSKFSQIKGFTSNPTLMAKAGISDYSTFIIECLKVLNGKPISFEVVSDDINEMYEQALRIASFAKNIYVKIPITNSKGHDTSKIIQKLTDNNIKVNITAITHSSQIDLISKKVLPKNEIILSIFSGRIADTGINPELIYSSLNKLNLDQNFKTLWASPREIYNLYQANECNVDIITITKDLLVKIKLCNKDLLEYSKETVQMFYEDGLKNKLSI
tara:strand:- start:5545 stop:6267 length:723 start_codon:yes stop_codon:yes gene_type:complete